jgi:hypothetical protein
MRCEARNEDPMFKPVAHVQNYADARDFLGNRLSRKIAHNTHVELRGGNTFAVRYHQTDVVTYHPDGRIVLNTGGWQTVTTKARFNTFTPARVYSDRRQWFVSTSNCQHRPFFDGMNVGAEVEDPRRPYDHVGAIMAFESGDLDEDATIELFQHLVDTGMAWSLQGSYGRMAKALIDAGMVRRAA